MSEVEEERVRASLSETTVVHSTINKEVVTLVHHTHRTESLKIPANAM